LIRFFFILPAVTLGPSAGPPGSSVSVSGTNFGGGEAVDIYFDTADEALAEEGEIAVVLPGGATKTATLAGRDPSTNVALLPGLKVADTSLIAYFDGPDTPWTQGTVTLYTDADRVNPVHEATFTFEQAEAQACRQFAKYCWTLSNADGWGLVAGTKYVVTVTLNAADGSGQVSDFSAPATPERLETFTMAPPGRMRRKAARLQRKALRRPAASVSSHSAALISVSSRGISTAALSGAEARTDSRAARTAGSRATPPS